MTHVKTRGLPDGAHAERTYEFYIFDEERPPRVDIPGDWRGDASATPLWPEQERWMRTWEGAGCRASWDCQWTFSDPEVLARFRSALEERAVQAPPPPPPPPPEPPPLSWRERLERLEAPPPPVIPDWDVAESWERFEGWLARSWPELRADLRPPARKRDLARLEAALGRPIPDELRQSLARHDGQRSPIFEGPGVIGNWELLSISRILSQRTPWQKHLAAGTFADRGHRALPGPGVRGVWWSAAWVPLTYDGAGGHHCADLDPAPGGATGQILIVRPGEAERRVRYPGIRVWLAGIAHALESGRFRAVEVKGRRDFYDAGFL